MVLYTLKAKERAELKIDWSLGYKELGKGEYRLIKKNFRKVNSIDSRSYRVFGEFIIK